MKRKENKIFLHDVRESGEMTALCKSTTIIIPIIIVKDLFCTDSGDLFCSDRYRHWHSWAASGIASVRVRRGESERNKEGIVLFPQGRWKCRLYIQGEIFPSRAFAWKDRSCVLRTVSGLTFKVQLIWCHRQRYNTCVTSHGTNIAFVQMGIMPYITQTILSVRQSVHPSVCPILVLQVLFGIAVVWSDAFWDNFY